jgi:hypothetical protein
MSKVKMWVRDGSWFAKIRRVQFVPVYSCPVVVVSAVPVPVPGYRRVNGYTGTDLRRADHLFFWKKPVVPTARRSYPVPADPWNLNFKNSPPVHIKSIPVPRTRRTRCTRRPVNPLEFFLINFKFYFLQSKLYKYTTLPINIFTFSQSLNIILFSIFKNFKFIVPKNIV